jgi:hypothetical protein
MSLYKYKTYTFDNILAAAGTADTSNNILTNYKVNSVSLKFLKPFYTGTTNATTFDSNPKMYSDVSYNSSSTVNKFCPKYTFYAGNANANDNQTEQSAAAFTNIGPPSGATNMLVILVGGGGGGGGGNSNSSTRQPGGVGGGGGAISVIYVGAAVYSLSVGKGGLYGLAPNATSTNGPGTNGKSNGSGSAGATGGETSILVGGITYKANGGTGGEAGSTSAVGEGGAAATTGTFTIYSYAGNNGASGSAGISTGGPGGDGGLPKFTEIINTNLLNLVSAQCSKRDDNIATTTLLKYGEGGHGGRGDSGTTGDFARCGEYGAPGCAFVFFYYN